MKFVKVSTRKKEKHSREIQLRFLENPSIKPNELLYED